jgi:hypothetical protein
MEFIGVMRRSWPLVRRGDMGVNAQKQVDPKCTRAEWAYSPMVAVAGGGHH